jgi:hypothetical protein
MIFENSSRIYPIRNVPNNVPGVSYHTSPKGWMDKHIFAEYIIDEQSYQGDVNEYPKHVFVDNCTGHNHSERLTAILARKNTALCYLPPCTTHLYQPTNTFIISKIKEAWGHVGRGRNYS